MRVPTLQTFSFLCCSHKFFPCSTALSQTLLIPFFFFARVSISGVYEFSVFLKPFLPRPATCSKLVGCSKDLTIDVTISLQFTFLPCGSFIFWIPFSLLLIYSLILVTVSSSRLFDTGEVVQLGIRLKVEVILR